MRSDPERQELLKSVKALYPQGCTTAKDMVQIFSRQGIWEVSVTSIIVNETTRQKQFYRWLFSYGICGSER